MLKAIYMGATDASQKESTYAYDSETMKFHLISDKEVSYSFDSIINNKDFILFATSGDVWYEIESIKKANKPA